MGGSKGSGNDKKYKMEDGGGEADMFKKTMKRKMAAARGEGGGSDMLKKNLGNEDGDDGGVGGGGGGGENLRGLKNQARGKNHVRWRRGRVRDRSETTNK